MMLAEIDVPAWTGFVTAIGAVLTTISVIIHAILSYLRNQKADAKTDVIIQQNEAIQAQNETIAGVPPPLPPKAQAIVESIVDKAEIQK